MTIETIRLAHYRSHTDTALEMVPGLNILAGPIGTGKTSVLYAIAAAMTGRNMLTDALTGWRKYE